MKKKIILGLLGLAFITGLGVADDLVPVAVSPGTENGPAVVRQSCPTFSWTAVSWALTYKVVVFEATGENVPTYENMAATASPVLVKEIPGQAFSWTPSAEEQLLNGGRYLWYIGAMVNAAQGQWSVGRRFTVVEGPGWGVVSEPREERIEADGDRRVLRDKESELTAAPKKNFNLADDPLQQQMIDVEGTEGNSNTFYGLDAGNGSMSGLSNSFFGRYAGNSNTSGHSNTFMGRAAGRLNKTGYENTFLGYQAGSSNTIGEQNVFIGSSAGSSNTSGYENTFLGYQAGSSNTDGEQNVFIGFSAGSSNTSGYENTFLGHMAGTSSIAAIDNALFGSCAGRDITDGDYNTMIGKSAGENTTNGEENTFIGDFAGCDNNGNQNVFVGNEAGQDNLGGSGNVFIGNEAGQNETGSNKLYIDNSGTPGPLIYGDFSSNILKFNGNVGIKKTPTHLLDIGTSGAYCNGGAWVDGSSREFKENIEELASTEALRAFQELEPVKFNYKENKEETYLGFIAEDVPDLVAMNDRKGLNPMDMVAMLTKVVQEQSKVVQEQMKVNQEQQKALSSQQKEISVLKEKITKLEKRSRKEK